MQQLPSSYYGGKSELWTCIFPGKMGISWKRSWGEGTKEEAEAEATKNCNVIAVPFALWARYKEYENRTVVAERKLMDELRIRVDYVDGKPVFVELTKQ